MTKVNVKLVPAFHTYLTFTLVYTNEKERKPEYKIPQTTDGL